MQAGEGRMAVVRRDQSKSRGVRLEVHNDMVRFPYHDPKCLICLLPGPAPGEPLRKGLGSKRKLDRGIFLGYLRLTSRDTWLSTSHSQSRSCTLLHNPTLHSHCHRE